MATAPKNGEGKSGRKGGPRPKKDKVVFLLCKGDVQEVKVALTAEEVLDIMETDPNWKRQKVVIPAKKGRAVATPADTANAA